MHAGKTLMNEINKEYMEQIKANRLFKAPNYRSGDVVDVTMFKSMSEGKFHKYRGVVYGTKNLNSLDKSFKVLVNEAEMNFGMQVKEFSPLVAKIEIHKYGSNKLRNKLNHILDLDLPKNKVVEPIIKGRDYKARDKRQEKKFTASAEREKGKIKRDSTKMEEPYKD